jgi:formamidopyrimidine-DNA glycosylase
MSPIIPIKQEFFDFEFYAHNLVFVFGNYGIIKSVAMCIKNIHDLCWKVWGILGECRQRDVCKGFRNIKNRKKIANALTEIKSMDKKARVYMFSNGGMNIMMELPEAIVISKQINEFVKGKKIINVTAAYSPHKFASYHGDPLKYHDLLVDKVVGIATGFGSMVEIKAEDAVILFGEGVGIRFHSENDKRPQKHQLLIEFNDFSAISASIQMYGGLWCFKEGDFKNPYFLQAKEKPSPLSDEFNYEYLDNIVSVPGNEKLSVKALLATEQRIPGLGNGVLQDILFNARIHPKKKVKTLTASDMNTIYNSIKTTLAEMTIAGGRDTEKDIFGCFGGYKTKLSKNTVDKTCDICGNVIKKEAYLGGSIYYCEGCQKL